MNYMLKWLCLIENGPYVVDTNFISTRPMLSRSSLRLVHKLFNNYYNFWQKRGYGETKQVLSTIKDSVPLIRGESSKVDYGIKKEKSADLRLRDAQPA